MGQAGLLGVSSEVMDKTGPICVVVLVCTGIVLYGFMVICSYHSILQQ